MGKLRSVAFGVRDSVGGIVSQDSRALCLLRALAAAPVALIKLAADFTVWQIHLRASPLALSSSLSSQFLEIAS